MGSLDFKGVDLTQEVDWDEFLKGLGEEEGAPVSEIFIDSGANSDRLTLIKKVDAIESKVNHLLLTGEVREDIALGTRRLFDKIRFMSFGTECIFNPPPRDEYESMRPGVIACVYNEDGTLEYVNSGYIEAAGLDDPSLMPREKWVELIGEDRMHLSLLDRVKILASEEIYDEEVGAPISKLYHTIYAGETKKRVMNKVTSLGVISGYTDVFEMALTGKLLLWRTLKNDKFKGNIRSAIEVSRTHPLLKRIISENKQKELGTYKEEMIPSFGFNSKIVAFKMLMDIILSGKPGVGNRNLPSLKDLWSNDEHTQETLNELLRLSILGDTFADSSYYAIRGFDGDNFINREFIKHTNYSYNDLIRFLNDGTFVEKVYGDSELKNVTAHIESLKRNGHYNNLFFPIKGTGRLSVNWDTFSYGNKTTKEGKIKTFGIGALQD